MKTTLITSVVVLALRATAALAVPGDPIDKLYSDDPYQYKDFGRSVAVSGTRAIVGSIGDRTNGSVAGAAYLFDLSTGQQTAKLLASDGGPSENFGISVAINGPLAIVGAYTKGDLGDRSGAAYIFDASTGTELFKLLPSDGGTKHYFGSAVAISGNVAVVGAFGNDINGQNSGAVYFFNAQTGAEFKKWIPSDNLAGDSFGSSVAVDRNLVIAGAPYRDTDGDNTGSAYVYDLNLNLSLGHLSRGGAEAGDVFGIAVAISGSTGLVTCPGDDDNGSTSGSAYLFDLTNGNVITKILPDDGAAHDRFGWGASMWGSSAIVGSHSDDDEGVDSGSAYLFDSITGQQIDKLLPGDGEREDWFGYSVGISGNTVIVGSLADDDYGKSSGSAYVFSSCPEDLLLTATPDIVQSGDQLNLTSFGGTPNRPVLLAVVFVNGIPVFVPIVQSLFNSECRHILITPIPPGLAGLSITFQSIGATPTGFQFSNGETVSFQ